MVWPESITLRADSTVHSVVNDLRVRDMRHPSNGTLGFAISESTIRGNLGRIGWASVLSERLERGK
ncbi:hypothetical protein CH249_20025 [Rhodococcus sp. 05-2255-3B1]|nr:hypothetical protein CH249_20025 [Rhodococcus sp. 05-2255-3B1]OZE12759.1 hypothetical protein CH255_26075 [Rhodococcus sp. 05-2255-2A2]OZE16935.1 hypothetical protein CH250_00625 [Rhodococcus sp. 05-2255-3C]